MCAIVLPHTFHDNADETASGSQVMDNLNALKGPIEAREVSIAGVLVANPLFVTVVSEPELGVAPFIRYTESAVSFPTACLMVWVGGMWNFSDGAHATSVAALTSAFVEPLGKNVQVTCQNGSGITVHPKIRIVAVGH